jgi:hypothetical protein
VPSQQRDGLSLTLLRLMGLLILDGLTFVTIALVCGVTNS